MGQLHPHSSSCPCSGPQDDCEAVILDFTGSFAIAFHVPACTTAGSSPDAVSLANSRCEQPFALHIPLRQAMSP